jgi:signal transduction histidine kinase
MLYTRAIGELQDGFYVTDDGLGIPDGQLDDVLTPGYSTSEGETRFAIVIAKEVDDAHGWETNVSKDQGVGLTLK